MQGSEGLLAVQQKHSSRDMEQSNKKTLSLTHLVLKDLLPFLFPYLSTISPNAGFYQEIGKTQPENLRFRHDFFGY